MNIIAFIVEYNPFHNGHKYHLDASRASKDSSYSIALMSGSFVQRGEPALVDKWTRARMAIANGVDLVLELPYIYSCQSAELFARGSIDILNSLNVVNYLSFGSELGELEALYKIAEILSWESDFFKYNLREGLNKGLSYPLARSFALEQHLKKDKSWTGYPYEDILRGSNNILAIEYLKALIKTNSDIEPMTIKRIGPNYNDQHFQGNIASATGIREAIFNKGLDSIKDYLPEENYSLLRDFHAKNNNFNSIHNYKSLLQYLSFSKRKEDISNILDIEKGLENRIIDKLNSNDDIVTIIKSISSKRYPLTRIQRILMHLLSGLEGHSIRRLYNKQANYIRILASNSRGLEILNKIKNKSSVNIISKYSSYKKLYEESINEFLYYEEKATDLYFWGLNPNNLELRQDFYRSPYIE